VRDAAEAQAFVERAFGQEMRDRLTLSHFGKEPALRATLRGKEPDRIEALPSWEGEVLENRVVAHEVAVRVLGEALSPSGQPDGTETVEDVGVDEARDRNGCRAQAELKDVVHRVDGRSSEQAVEDDAAASSITILTAAAHRVHPCFIPFEDEVRIVAGVCRHRRVLDQVGEMSQPTECVGKGTVPVSPLFAGQRTEVVVPRVPPRP